MHDSCLVAMVAKARYSIALLEKIYISVCSHFSASGCVECLSLRLHCRPIIHYPLGEAFCEFPDKAQGGGGEYGLTELVLEGFLGCAMLAFSNYLWCWPGNILGLASWGFLVECSVSQYRQG